MDRREFLEKISTLAIGSAIGIVTLKNKPFEITHDPKGVLLTEGAVWLPVEGSLTDTEFSEEFDKVYEEYLKGKIYIAHMPYRNGTLILLKDDK